MNEWEDWCVHHATLLSTNGACVQLQAALRGEGLAPDSQVPFAYVVTSERELLPHAEVLQRISKRMPRPRLILVGVRRSFKDADQLARKWGRR
jgi:hypothetical protein